MNPNEEQFPEGARIRITEEYGKRLYAGAEEILPVHEDFVVYHGREGTVLPYTDIHENYVRVKFDVPSQIGLLNSMLVMPTEIEVL